MSALDDILGPQPPSQGAQREPSSPMAQEQMVSQFARPEAPPQPEAGGGIQALVQGLKEVLSKAPEVAKEFIAPTSAGKEGYLTNPPQRIEKAISDWHPSKMLFGDEFVNQRLMQEKEGVEQRMSELPEDQLQQFQAGQDLQGLMDLLGKSGEAIGLSALVPGKGIPRAIARGAASSLPFASDRALRGDLAGATGEVATDVGIEALLPIVGKGISGVTGIGKEVSKRADPAVREAIELGADLRKSEMDRGVLASQGKSTSGLSSFRSGVQASLPFSSRPEANRQLRNLAVLDKKVNQVFSDLGASVSVAERSQDIARAMNKKISDIRKVYGEAIDDIANVVDAPVDQIEVMNNVVSELNKVDVQPNIKSLDLGKTPNQGRVEDPTFNYISNELNKLMSTGGSGSPYTWKDLKNMRSRVIAKLNNFQSKPAGNENNIAALAKMRTGLTNAMREMIPDGEAKQAFLAAERKYAESANVIDRLAKVYGIKKANVPASSPLSGGAADVEDFVVYEAGPNASQKLVSEGIQGSDPTLIADVSKVFGNDIQAIMSAQVFEDILTNAKMSPIFSESGGGITLQKHAASVNEIKKKINEKRDIISKLPPEHQAIIYGGLNVAEALTPIKEVIGDTKAETGVVLLSKMLGAMKGIGVSAIAGAGGLTAGAALTGGLTSMVPALVGAALGTSLFLGAESALIFSTPGFWRSLAERTAKELPDQNMRTRVYGLVEQAYDEYKRKAPVVLGTQSSAQWLKNSLGQRGEDNSQTSQQFQQVNPQGLDRPRDNTLEDLLR